MQFIVSTIAFMAGLASASPAVIPRGVGTTFNLLSVVDSTTINPFPELATGNRWVVGARNGQAIVTQDRTLGALFYEYGSGPSVGTANVGITITPGGTATIPNGKPIELVNNSATTDVKIANNALGIPVLTFQEGGRFQVCKNDDGFFLSYIAPGQRQLAACAVVFLISNCSSTGTGQESVGQLGEPIEVGCQPH